MRYLYIFIAQHAEIDYLCIILVRHYSKFCSKNNIAERKKERKVMFSGYWKEQSILAHTFLMVSGHFYLCQTKHSALLLSKHTSDRFPKEHYSQRTVYSPA